MTEQTVITAITETQGNHERAGKIMIHPRKTFPLLMDSNIFIFSQIFYMSLFYTTKPFQCNVGIDKHLKFTV